MFLKKKLQAREATAQNHRLIIALLGDYWQKITENILAVKIFKQKAGAKSMKIISIFNKEKDLQMSTHHQLQGFAP